MVAISLALSWNSARLLALVLNALHGLLNYYERDYTEIDVDGLFGLRIIEGTNRLGMLGK